MLCNGAGGAPALDNGRGSSRTAVLRHKHEILSGHTSSISAQQCAYDRCGCCVCAVSLNVAVAVSKQRAFMLRLL